MEGSSFQFGAEPTASAVAIAEVPPGLSTKTALLDELDHQLRFPDYFGGNWDALEECLRDFSWLPSGAVLVRHHDLPLVGEVENLKTYLSILNDAVEKWSRSGERELIVVFPPEAQERVAWLLRSARHDAG